MKRSDLLTPQPPPVHATGDVWRDAIDDITECSPEFRALMEERRLFGIAKHGTPVQADNGRDGEADAVQEVLDSVVYAEREAQRWEQSGSVNGPFLAAEWRRHRDRQVYAGDDMLRTINLVKMLENR